MEEFCQTPVAGRVSSGCLDTLARHAFDADPARAAGIRGRLLGEAVEPLADAYRPDARRALERLMARLVSHARGLPDPRAGRLDERLTEWGLADEAALLARTERRRQQGPCRVPPDAVRCALVLSRVTIGADALLTSVALQKLARVFPRARIVFVGPQKNGALLAGEGKVEVRAFAYPRGGPFADAFFAWCALADELVKETGCEGGETLVVDPDTRLLQSGLLPVAPVSREGRIGFAWDPTAASDAEVSTGLGHAFHAWLERTFGADESGDALLPALSLSESDRAFGARLRAELDAGGGRRVVSVSFGVGGNRSKRVGAEAGPDPVSHFERDLLLGLLRTGADVVLDLGAGEAELGSSRALLEAVRAAGALVVEVAPTGALPRPAERAGDARLVAFEGSVSRAAGVIGASDLFVGYDSQGQHVAAALGVDVVTVFAGYPHERFPDLWQPLGRGHCEVIRAGMGASSPSAQAALVERVLGRPVVAALAKRRSA